MRSVNIYKMAFIRFSETVPHIFLLKRRSGVVVIGLSNTVSAVSVGVRYLFTCLLLEK